MCSVFNYAAKRNLSLAVQATVVHGNSQEGRDSRRLNLHTLHTLPVNVQKLGNMAIVTLSPFFFLVSGDRVVKR